MKRRIISMMFVLCMVLTWIPAQAFASEVDSGSCGDDVRWVLDDTGTLTISGTGDMERNSSYMPWDDYTDQILRVVIEPGVTGICSKAFYCCSQMTAVTIPDTVDEIDYEAFAYCRNLSKVTLPSSIRNIAESSFYRCEKLTEITIPDRVTAIEEDAFAYCYVLTTVNIGKGVSSIHSTAFDYCYQLAEVVIAAENSHYSVDEHGVLFNKERTVLISALISEISGIYEIPDGVAQINEDAFNNCDNLTAVIMPDSVTELGASAFAYCSALSTVTLSKSLSAINDYTFYSCESLSSVTIPEGVASIGDKAFGYCDDLTELNLPDNITAIGEYAFMRCENLTEAVIPAGVTAIADGVFYACESLTSVTIPDNVTAIGSEAFSNCTNLVSLKLGKGVSEISKSAFSDCNRLSSVVLDQENPHYFCDERGVFYNKEKTELKFSMFSNLEGEYRIPTGVTVIGENAFSNCKALTAVTIPDTVTVISDNAFSKCSALTDISIPDSVTTIGNQAFSFCISLSEITIPASVAVIGDSAFEYCTMLRSITFLGNCPQIGEDALEHNLLIAYFPGDNDTWTEEAKDTYGATVSWKVIGDNSINTVAEGQCGDQATWTYDELGVLTISGNGAMWDVDDDAPWSDYNSQILSVVVGDGITYIGTKGLASLWYLEELTLPDTLEAFGEYAFARLGYNGYGVTVVLPEGITEIPKYAFSRATIKSITFPSTLTSVEAGAFEWCYGIEEVHIPSMECWMNIQFDSFYATPFSMVRNALLYVDGEPVTDIVIPYGTTEIKEGQFASYSAMTSVRIPDTVTRVGDEAFGMNINGYNGTSQLKEIVFPASVTYIGEIALQLQGSLEKIVILNPDCEIMPYMYSMGLTGLVGEAVIYGYAGSTAQAYAESEGRKFVPLDTYEILEGAGATVNPADGYAIRVDGELAKFDGVAVDGVAVSEDCYTVTEGSTIVNFAPAYLETLGEGEHSIIVFFQDGTAAATMNISALVCGDCNGDGKVNGLDLILLRQHLAGWDVEPAMGAADTNGDGKINGLDLILLRQYLAGWEVTLG